MSRIAALAALSGALLLAAGGAHALDYVSVADRSATLYEADSLTSTKLYVVSRYTPLEQILTSGDWVKVRDRAGTLAWIEKRALSSKRYVIVTAATATVRQAPEQKAAVVFQAAQNVALEWLAPSGGGWIKVRHEDGTAGYVRATEVWGDE